jgi:hypothetical protein
MGTYHLNDNNDFGDDYMQVVTSGTHVLVTVPMVTSKELQHMLTN